MNTSNRPPVRIVHLGLGAFFRAHGCSYLQDTGGWGVLGVSLRSPAVRDALRYRDYCYTAASLTPEGMALRQIDVVRDVLVAPEDPVAVIAAMANPAVSIVSMTITEKGYCHDPATGKLNLDHPAIKADIANALPQSAPGFLVRGLQARRAKGLPSFTVLSCDNLPDNGALTRAVTLNLAQQIDPKLADWIASECAFPSSMVDRIVPATKPEDIAHIQELSHINDAAPVLHEPFSQWVITDDFKGNVPDLATVGVQIVPDILPFENMKLRMLNGAHSALAYLGLLAGFRTVAQAVADEDVANYLRYLWSIEIIPTLTAPPNTNLEDYATALLKRFANKGIKHQLAQIAMDGSQKLPQRLFGTIEDRLAVGANVDALLLAVAAWIARTAEQEESDDPMSVAMHRCHSKNPMKTVTNILSQDRIFNTRLAARLEKPLGQLYTDLCQQEGKLMLRAISQPRG
jgi:fructuronate reductase